MSPERKSAQLKVATASVKLDFTPAAPVNEVPRPQSVPAQDTPDKELYIPSASAPPEETVTFAFENSFEFDRSDILNGIVLSEILGKPKALRRRSR